MSQILEKQSQEYKPRELTPQELEKVNENEKKVLLAPIGGEGSIWSEYISKNGKKSAITAPHLAFGNMPGFYTSLLKAQDPKSPEYASHFLYEGFKFGKWSDGTLTRIEDTGKSGSGWSGQSKKPRYVEKLYTHVDIDTINRMLEENPDQNWELFPQAVGDRVVLVKYKA